MDAAAALVFLPPGAQGLGEVFLDLQSGARSQGRLYPALDGQMCGGKISLAVASTAARPSRAVKSRPRCGNRNACGRHLDFQRLEPCGLSGAFAQKFRALRQGVFVSRHTSGMAGIKPENEPVQKPPPRRCAAQKQLRPSGA